MQGSRGREYEEKWNAVLTSGSGFGKRFRIYEETKLSIRDRAFDPHGEYAEFERMVRSFAQSGAKVVVVNSPESALLLRRYESSDYYRGYLEFFRGLAAKYDGVRFVDLRDSLPPEDFNDWHHPNYVGVLRLGPTYAQVLGEELRVLVAKQGAS
jgi:hypothetical protein